MLVGPTGEDARATPGKKAWQEAEGGHIMRLHLDPGALSPSYLQSGRPDRAGRLQPPNLNHDQIPNKTL